MNLLKRLGVSNVVGFLGLLLVVAAVVMLAGLWWGVLLLGLCLVGFAYQLGRDEHDNTASLVPEPTAGPQTPSGVSSANAGQSS